jgi:uracil phosphoribosyltransferase
MEYTINDHPLVSQKLTELRDLNTDSITFRHLVQELVTLLAYEATRNMQTVPKVIQTPISPFEGVAVKNKPLIVPVLRAGLGMLEGMQRVLSIAEVGFLGIKRNEATLQPETYANRLPDDVAGRQCYVIDPMLATGGTLVDSINYLYDRGARDITCICIISAPEGVKHLHNTFEAEKYSDLALRVFVAGEDTHLNEQGYIVPGLGDAGDRLYGV